MDSKNTSYSYTVVKSKSNYVKHAPFSISFIILNRGTKIFREDLFEFLSNFDFIKEIIAIEKHSNKNSFQMISDAYDKLKFILLSEDITNGEKINLAMDEAKSDFVFVLQSDMYLLNPFWIPNIFDEIMKKKSVLIGGEFFDKSEEPVPSVFLPTIGKNSKLKIISVQTENDYEKSLITIDYCGLYFKEKFKQIGGFDSRINSEYYQKIDFGLRATYFSEDIYIYKKLRIQYTTLSYPEDTSKTKSYLFFLLKNYVPVFIGNGVSFSFLRFIKVSFLNGINPFKFRNEFKEIKEEIMKNSLRFRGDLKSAIELWENNIIN